MPAGNSGYVGHAYHTLFASSDSEILQVRETTTTLFISFLWTDAADLELSILTPSGSPVVIPADGSTLKSSGYKFYSNQTVSPRGTHRLDLEIGPRSQTDKLGGDWGFSFTGPTVQIHGYQWAINGKGYWINHVNTRYTGIWPATADNAIAVGGFYLGYGTFALYSSQGPRIDGASFPAITAPSNTMWFPNAYVIHSRDFGAGGAGTSWSAPQVAGAAALLKELCPDLTTDEFRTAIQASAYQDEYVLEGGPDLWGAGKLRINAAIAYLLGEESEKAARAPRHPDLKLTASPNPFNPAAKIRCYLAGDEPARVRVFAVDGTEVWDTELPAGPAGWREVTWLGVDRGGRAMSSGVYFFHVKQGAKYAVTKAVLVK
jgi:hypothetical protein